MGTNRWFILGALFLARTAMGFQFQSVVGVSSFLNADLGIGLGDLGVLVGAYMLPGIVVALPGGTLGKRFGEKRIAVVGLLLMTVGGALTAVAGDFAMAALGRVISGAGAVVLNVLLTGMVAEWFARDRLVTAMAILVTSWPAGIGIALVTGPSVAAAAGWPAMMWLSAAASLVACALVAAVYRRPEAVPESAAEDVRGRLTARDFWLASWSGQVWALYNVGYILVVSFMPALMFADGASPTTAGLVTSLATWILIITVPLGGLLIDRIGHNVAIMQLSFAVMAVAMAATAVIPAALAIVVVVGLFAGPSAGAIMALPAGVLRAAVRTTGMGIYFTWYYVAMAVLPPFAGWLGDSTGVVSAPLVFGSAVMVAAMASLVVFLRYSASADTGSVN
jgi:MFS family permease